MTDFRTLLVSIAAALAAIAHPAIERIPPGARAKLKDWTARYLPLEIIATASALIGALTTSLFTSNGVAIAFGGTWGENAGYYTYAIAREMRAQRVEDPDASTARRWQRGLTNIVYEFGVAEFIDSFMSRPFFMFVGPLLLGNLTFGIIAGKFAADVIFYGIAIMFYERRKSRR